MLSAKHKGIAVAFRPDLQCEAMSLRYDFDARVGRLDMPQTNACDMAGCIALFERIDSGVERIDTFSGSKPDTSYVRNGQSWLAQSARD